MLLYLFSRVSKDKGSIAANQRPSTAVDKESEIERRRKEIARKKEIREKLIQEEVWKKILLKSWFIKFLFRPTILLRNKENSLRGSDTLLFNETVNSIGSN